MSRRHIYIYRTCEGPFIVYYELGQTNLRDSSAFLFSREVQAAVGHIIVPRIVLRRQTRAKLELDAKKKNAGQAD